MFVHVVMPHNHHHIFKPSKNIMIELIWAQDENGAIGYEQKLLYHIPRDLDHFKKITSEPHKTLLMGRKTFESIPKSAKHNTRLPGRRKVVLSRNKPKVIQHVDTLYVTSVVDWLEFTDFNTPSNEKILTVIGGAGVYSDMIKHAHVLHVTRISIKAPRADVYAPVIDENVFELKRSSPALCLLHESASRTISTLANCSFETWVRR